MNVAFHVRYAGAPTSVRNDIPGGFSRCSAGTGRQWRGSGYSLARTYRSQWANNHRWGMASTPLALPTFHSLCRSSRH